MTTKEDLLYLPTVSNDMCPEIGLVPFTHLFISMAFTLVFFVISQRIFTGTNVLTLIITGLILTWYIVCWIVDIYRDYTFYDRRPNYEVFARCLLNKEYNERLSMKLPIILILTQKFVSCLIAAGAGALGIKIFRFIVKLVIIFGIPALVGRGVAALGAGIGMGWPFIYLLIVGSALGVANAQKVQTNFGYLWIAGAELLLTGNDEEQTLAAGLMREAEGAMIEAGEDVPAEEEEDSAPPAKIVANDPSAEGEENKNDTPAPAAASAPKKKHTKLDFFVRSFDSTTLLFRILLIFGYAISAYTLVIAWDWQYGNNDISYGSSFSAFDLYRPTLQTLYDKSGELTSSQAGYIASLWC